jgi:hypothetical protein
MAVDDHAPDRTRVWVLLVWGDPSEPDPTDPEDWPIPGALLGVFATRRAALQELAEWCAPEELARMRWIQPGGSADYQELRGAGPDRTWFSLERERVRRRGGGRPEWLRRHHTRRAGP